jgi:predicted RNA binding protein YcfA (HicA-like mRNA interferase family)
MSRLPSLAGDDIVKALLKIGFVDVRQKGNHVYLKHPDDRATVVPVPFVQYLVGYS